jgi:hypothetical protein
MLTVVRSLRYRKCVRLWTATEDYGGHLVAVGIRAPKGNHSGGESLTDSIPLTKGEVSYG